MSKPSNLANLDAVARQLFKAGHHAAARVVHGALRELAGRGIDPDLSEIRSCPVMLPEEWASASGYALHRHTLDMPMPRIDPAQLGDGLTPLWAAASERWMSTLAPQGISIDARNAVVNSFAWPTGPRQCDEQINIFSENYSLLIEDRFWLRFTEGKYIFRSLTPDSSRFLIDFSGSPLQSLPGHHMLIGSRGNWSHWLVDFLAKIHYYDSHPEKEAIKLVFGKLTENHKRCLECFGIPERSIVELDVLPTKALRYAFERLTVTTSVPKPFGFDYLRGKFAKTAERLPAGPELVYLSRRNYAPRHRMINEDEVVATLTKRGFATVCIETLPFEEQLAVLNRAKVIVMSLGGDIGNLAMCNPQATVVMTTARSYANNTALEIAQRETVPFVFGNGLPTIPVLGEPADPANASIDSLATFDVSRLNEAIDKALDLQRQTWD